MLPADHIMRKLAVQVLTAKNEFAPGIPIARETKVIPYVSPDSPETWHISTQIHEAEKAGRHLDLRLVSPDNDAHSWAIPAGELPKPGHKVLAIKQPTHTKEYAARKGTFQIEEGYGKGTVTSSGLVPVEVVRSKPGHIRFNLYGGRGIQEFNLIDTPKGTLLHNITSTAESGVRGDKGQPIPNAKPDYKELNTGSVRFDNPEEVHQAKVDGAHCTVHLRPDAPVKVFSFRPTERESGVIEHTHKLPNYRSLIAPKELAGTVLRGELYGVDTATNRSLPAETTGGLLNASVWNSREKQKELGAVLRPTIFDVVRYKGKVVENAPYSEKLRILEEVQSKVPRLQLPPTARDTAEKVKLFGQIQSGQHPVTSEGVIIWNLNDSRPTKAKFRPDVDVEVVGVTKGEGKHEGRIGALQVRLPGKDAITHVGTGFSDTLREDIAKDPQKYIGRVAKVHTMQVFPSGKLRAPSFGGWHLEKGKEASIVKEGSDKLNIAAYVIGPSGAGKTTYVKQHYPADKYFILHSDRYARKRSNDTVSIDWEKALLDGQMSGKPIVIDSYHTNSDLMKLAKEKILLDPGKVITLSQLISRRKKSLNGVYKYSPEEKLERFNKKARPTAETLGFKEKTATIRTLAERVLRGHHV